MQSLFKKFVAAVKLSKRICDCGCGEEYPAVLCVKIKTAAGSEHVYWQHHRAVYGERSHE